jgi:hypothetical protein
MAWRTVGSGRYYQMTYRVADGRFRTRYYGRGPLALAVASLHTFERERRAEVRQAIREAAEPVRQLVRAARRRIISLGAIVDRAMTAGGFYRHSGCWRRRGVTTMRSIKMRATDIQQAIEREAARRHFESLDGDELATAIDRLNIEMSDIALQSLLELVTSDPYRREACLRRVEDVERELAGEAPSPLVRLLARSVAILRIEKYVSDTKFYRITEVGMETSIAAAALRWRALADRQLNAEIRTLAYVRNIEASSIEKTIGRLRLVG